MPEACDITLILKQVSGTDGSMRCLESKSGIRKAAENGHRQCLLVGGGHVIFSLIHVTLALSFNDYHVHTCLLVYPPGIHAKSAAHSSKFC